ncbi:MAG: CDP-diacylglycerol--glycerol-3-phosphate 3-phosphatidyltransferase [Rhodanobacteraceae bacterium]|jgi:cardiolipin synthase|nr:MAG: CDP-diacylglycerol--glycerol-3-phosphate 3-phosphatidyltransferase [Rhodanobacteraceae bacterium]
MLRHLPNLISLLRIALVAPLIAAILSGRYQLALVIAVVAGVSDGVDGYLARHFGWQSRLGSILDPAADKLMLVGCMLALGWLHEAARWLVALVVARDLVIVLGAWAWHRVMHSFEARPSWLSKTTTVAQIGFVLLVLADQAFGWHAGMTIPAGVVALLTAASGIDYVVRWGLMARRELKGKRPA